MSDLVVYDTESNDADTRHGQITQFGAIKADMALNPIEEINLRVRRLPWIVPMPKALEVTKMEPRDLSQPGSLSEYVASGEIERFLVPGYGMERVMLTFNGPRFDDELIRTTLFRNLRKPWFSSGKQTTKVDLLSVVQLVHASSPGAIVVPTDGEGKLTWRLEKLCPANGIDMSAHDALSDAAATLSLARLVKQRAPWAWQTALECGRAARVESLLSDAAKSGRAVYLFTHFGAPDIVPCAVLGTDEMKKWILADLRKEKLPTATDEIAEVIFSKGTPFPVIRSNTGPLFIDAAAAARMDSTIDSSGIAAKAMGIKLNSAVRQGALAALKDRQYAASEGMTSEEKIYSGFISDRDTPAMTKFHRSDWESRMAIQFGDARLQDFAARIFVDACRAGDLDISPERLAAYEAQCSEALSRPHAGEGARWATIKSAMESGANPEWIEWASEAFAEAPLGGVGTEESQADVHDEDIGSQQMELSL